MEITPEMTARMNATNAHRKAFFGLKAIERQFPINRAQQTAATHAVAVAVARCTEVGALLF